MNNYPRPLSEFDMHDINRLIMREQIPGFKMLPKEEALLKEYREALMGHYNYAKGETNETNRIDKAEIEANRNKRNHRKKHNRQERVNEELPMADDSEQLPTPEIEETSVETPEETTVMSEEE